MLKEITPQEAKQLVQEKTVQLIDIREPHEYASVHIRGARFIPEEILDKYPLRGEHDPKNTQLVFFCRSGSRVEKSEKLIAKLEPAAMVIKGGLNAWIQAGLPVERSKTTLPLFRQILIGAGGLVLVGVLGSAVWHPMYLLTAFVGAGLIFAGVTGFCGLGLFLKKMPWNKRTE